MIVALYIIPDKYVQRASAWHSILGMCQRVFWYSNHSVNNKSGIFKIDTYNPVKNAWGRIRTDERLRDGTLNPAPLT